jgi:D-alanyl-D-alanine carboxypeptidase
MVVRNPACGARMLVSGPTNIDATQLHRIGSVTKTFVAAVILTLAEDGALGLDDKLSKWVPDVAGSDGITIRQLLDHSSGLFNYTEDKTFWKAPPSKVWTPRQLVDVSLRNPVYFAPGTSWHYSNTNFILLGMIAETAGKAKLGPLVRTRVLAKAGLTATFFDGEEPVSGKLAEAFDASGDDATTVADPSWAWAAGAMVATPGDLATWIEKLGSGAFYDAKMQKELLTTIPTGSSGLSYGLGIMVFAPQLTGGGGTGIGHGGDISGYHNQAFYFPDSKTTLVSIVDSDADDPNEVSLAALEVLFKK